MPNGDPRDGFFYPTLKLVIDSYNITYCTTCRRHNRIDGRYLSSYASFTFQDKILQPVKQVKKLVFRVVIHKMLVLTTTLTSLTWVCIVPIFNIASNSLKVKYAILHTIAKCKRK